MKNWMLGTLLGDSYIAKKGEFRVDHCPEQLDYIDHIADRIRQEYNKNVSVYFRNKRNIYALGFYYSLFISHRQKYYPNDKKSLVSILNDIDNPIEAVAYWLMDDGCVHYSTQNKNYLSPRLLLATCSESKETHEFMIQWFQEHFGFKPYITIQHNHARKKEWLLLKFKVEDSYKLWQLVRHLIIPIPSMKNKFRIVEQEFKKDYYRIKYFHESPSTQRVENICRTNENKESLEVEDKKPLR